MDVGRPTASARGAGRWLSHRDITSHAWARAGWDTRLLGAGWLTSGLSAASYIIIDFQMSNLEI
jgi:hypothetical protein